MPPASHGLPELIVPRALSPPSHLGGSPLCRGEKPPLKLSIGTTTQDLGTSAAPVDIRQANDRESITAASVISTSGRRHTREAPATDT